MLVHRRRERQLPHCSTHCRVGKHSLSVGYIQSLHMHICIYIYINTRLSNKSENYIFSFIPLVLYIYIYIPVQYVCYVKYIYIFPIISSSNQPAAHYFSEFETERAARCPPNCPSERPGRMRALRSCSSGVFYPLVI